MADDIPARVDRFLEGFLGPVLVGGTAVVTKPHGTAYLDLASAARPADLATDAAIYAALHHGAAAVAPVVRVPYPDRGSVALALAGHDLLAITDPLLDRWGARRAVPKMLELVEDLVDAAGPVQTRGEALSRHVVVSRLFRLERRDVVVKNWTTATYHFSGRKVPANHLALPKLRRVRTEETARPVAELLRASEEKWTLPITRVARKLVAASPLTVLLEPGLFEPYRIGVAETAVLAEPSLRRAVARFLRAAPEEALVKYASALAAPELVALPAAARASVALLFAELGAEDALDREAGRTLEALVRGQPGAQVLAALFLVGLDATGLAHGLSPRDGALVRSRATAVRAALPSPALARAHRIVGTVDEDRSIPLEDAS